MVDPPLARRQSRADLEIADRAAEAGAPAAGPPDPAAGASAARPSAGSFQPPEAGENGKQMAKYPGMTLGRTSNTRPVHPVTSTGRRRHEAPRLGEDDRVSPRPAFRRP